MCDYCSPMRDHAATLWGGGMVNVAFLGSGPSLQTTQIGPPTSRYLPMPGGKGLPHKEHSSILSPLLLPCFYFSTYS